MLADTRCSVHLVHVAPVGSPMDPRRPIGAGRGRLFVMSLHVPTSPPFATRNQTGSPREGWRPQFHFWPWLVCRVFGHRYVQILYLEATAFSPAMSLHVCQRCHCRHVRFERWNFR